MAVDSGPTSSDVSPPASKPETITIHTSTIFDPLKKAFLKDQTITVSPVSGTILSITSTASPLPHADPKTSTLDLRHLPLLTPGLVDAHTHIFVHNSANEVSSHNQETQESPTERILRAANHCRAALRAGFTTYRDLGTEGVDECDLDVRNAINRGIIPGPRLLVATQPIASCGSYTVHGENPANANRPAISDPADGVYGVRAAVRRRVGAGADVIKVYADYRRKTMRFPPPVAPGAPDIQFPPPGPTYFNASLDTRDPNSTFWTQEELEAIVDEARRSRLAVAAHCCGNEAIKMAAPARVTSIEHGFVADDACLRLMKEHDVIFVPTLATAEQDATPAALEACLGVTRKAWEMGVRLACGGDTGVFAHGDNARELELMRRAGVGVEDVLVAATVEGWRACGGEWAGRGFGTLEVGAAADLVGFEADWRVDEGALRKVGFVMKDGKIWVEDGEPVGMV